MNFEAAKHQADPSKHPLATPPGTYAAATLSVKIVESPD